MSLDLYKCFYKTFTIEEFQSLFKMFLLGKKTGNMELSCQKRQAKSGDSKYAGGNC